MRPSKQAITFAIEEEVDSFVAVGGGSTIDTAKAANLYATYPADFLDYVNAPIGKGLARTGTPQAADRDPHPPPAPAARPPAPPSSTWSSMHAKTGISHRNLKPLLGIIDPENTATLSPTAVASTGCDVLSHALESYTAIGYTLRPYPERPLMRPAYQGSNPGERFVVRPDAGNGGGVSCRGPMADPEDREAREKMLLGCLICGYRVWERRCPLCPTACRIPSPAWCATTTRHGYAGDQPIVPHGFAVVLNAPAVFRFTAAAGPTRHTQCRRNCWART